MSDPKSDATPNTTNTANTPTAPAPSLKDRFYNEILRQGGKLPPSMQRFRRGQGLVPRPAENSPASPPAAETPRPLPTPSSPPAAPGFPQLPPGAGRNGTPPTPPTPPPPTTPSLAVLPASAPPAAPPAPSPGHSLPPPRQVSHPSPRPWPAPATPRARWYLRTQPLSQTPISAPQWVMRCPKGNGFLPAGLSVLVGDPGAGKSTLVRALIASLTTATGPFPVEKTGEALLLAWEDDEGSAILPHLLACGGDPRQVHMLRGIATDDGQENTWTPTPDNLELLRTFLEFRPEIRLVVVDVLSSMLALGGIDSSGSEEVRRLLEPLNKLGQEMGVAVLLLHHQNKRTGERALVRVSGSVQVTGTARVVWLLGTDADDAGLRQVAPVKCNLPGRSAGFAFREQAVDPQMVASRARLMGLGVPDNLPDYLFRGLEISDTQPVTAEDLQGKTQAAEAPLRQGCTDWILRRLEEEGGEMPSDLLLDEAVAQGFSQRTLERARGALKVQGKLHHRKKDGIWWTTHTNIALSQTANELFPPTPPTALESGL